MSYTEIYAFNKKGNAYMAGLAHNAWRGGMAVWNIMEERHLPLYIPEYIKKCNWYHPGMSEEEIITRNGFRPRRTAPTLSGKKEDNPTREIWALADDLEIPLHERIVLFTTFDDCLVKKEDIPRVIKAFRAFEGDDHKGETNLGIQADILQAIYDDPNTIAVGWNQTSVMCENWSNIGESENGEPIPYNCLTGDKHYWLFDELYTQENKKG